MTRRVILLVEDDPNDEALTIRALKSHQIPADVIVAHDGAEALELLFGEGSDSGRPAAELPDVMVLDLKLPKVDGIDVLRRVRGDARTSLLPVVILTSSNEDEDRLAGYRSGANSYVQKPVEFQDFANAIRQLGLYWVSTNQPPPPLRG